MSINLEGCLHLELNQQPIKIDCKGQSIHLTFPSLKALNHFLNFFKAPVGDLFFQLFKKDLIDLNLKYYINGFIVGESRSDLKPSWLGKYMGLERSKIYPRQIFNYFLSSFSRN